MNDDQKRAIQALVDGAGIGASVWLAGASQAWRAVEFHDVFGPPRHAETPVTLASASKIVYAAAACEGARSVGDDPLLQMSGGWVDGAVFGSARATVGQAHGGAVFNPTAVSHFWYDGASMQQHAMNAGLGGLDAAKLGAWATDRLGVPVEYTAPLVSGSARMAPADLLRLLILLARRERVLGDLLGHDTVPAGPDDDNVLNTPATQNWRYGLGHWVESPEGDGAFSSLGANGVYPWISAGRQWAGVIVPGRMSPRQSQVLGAAIRGVLASQPPKLPWWRRWRPWGRRWA